MKASKCGSVVEMVFGFNFEDVRSKVESLNFAKNWLELNRVFHDACLRLKIEQLSCK